MAFHSLFYGFIHCAHRDPLHSFFFIVAFIRDCVLRPVRYFLKFSSSFVFSFRYGECPHAEASKLAYADARRMIRRAAR